MSLCGCGHEVSPCLHVDMDTECLHVDTDTECIMSYTEMSTWIWIVTWRSPCGY